MLRVQKILFLLCPRCRKATVQVTTLGRILTCEKCRNEVFGEVKHA